MTIFHDATRLVGRTPLLALDRLKQKLGLKADIFAKLECFNPYSVKDRVALRIIDDAEASGALKPGGTIVEPTSGNTGIGLAFVGAVRGYEVVLVMPSSMSVERRKILKMLGAKIVLTDATLGMKGAVEEAERIAKESGAFIADQFANPSNAKAHEDTTAREILEDTGGAVDIFVATIGTGGTLTGNARALKAALPALKAYGVEPAASPLLTKGHAGPHNIQGIGANFVPEVLDMSVVDGVIDIADEDAYATSRLLARTEGVLVGISSGAALAAAISLAKSDENAGKKIVVVLPDTGERYVSTPLFDVD